MTAELSTTLQHVAVEQIAKNDDGSAEPTKLSEILDHVGMVVRDQNFFHLFPTKTAAKRWRKHDSTLPFRPEENPESSSLDALEFMVNETERWGGWYTAFWHPKQAHSLKEGMPCGCQE